MTLKTKTAVLAQPVTAFGKTYREFVLREPSASVYFDLGPLQTSYRVGDIESTQELPGVFRSYLERCCPTVEDATAWTVILLDLGLEDAVRLRRTFNAFFTDAVEKVLASEKPVAPVNEAAAA